MTKQFAIDGVVEVKSGQGGMPMVAVNGEHATAEIYLHGAHVTSFTPRGREPMVWMSSESQFVSTRAIRGGIPICWPWFGKLTGRPDLPQHGFARTSQWEIVGTNVDEHKNVVVSLQLSDSEKTREVWPHPFRLTVNFTIGSSMTIQLGFLNTGDESVEVGTALHTYFAVDRIEDVTVSGLDGRRFVDQLDDGIIKQIDGAILFDREVDLIAIDSEDVVTIGEASRQRKIQVSKSGSRSTVVWNPWIDKAKAMSDFPDDGYKTMLCIESANAACDVRVVAAGETHVVSQTIRYV